MSIHGKYAPQYWLKYRSGQLLRAEVQSIVLGEVLLVSSMYRTGIIYKSSHPQNGLIVQLWCAFVRKPYNTEVRRRFHQTFSTGETLENYFCGMLNLSRTAQWFEAYKIELNETARLEPNHSIILELKACEMSLLKNHAYEQYRQPLFDLESPVLSANKVPLNELCSYSSSARN